MLSKSTATRQLSELLRAACEPPADGLIPRQRAGGSLHLSMFSILLRVVGGGFRMD